MFETRSQAWQEVGLLDQVRPGVARRARVEALLLAVLFVAVVVLWDNRRSLIDHSTLRQIETPLAILVVVVLLVLGWAIARNVGRGLGPALFRRMEPATAGSVGFLIRLLTVAIALLVALGVAGVDPATLLLGGAFTAVIVGLAAQQTLGNVIAGTVLLSAGPFRVGDRVLLQGGQIGGQVDGVVSSLGLLYTTIATDGGLVMVPNSVVLNVAIVTQRGAAAGAQRGGAASAQRGGAAAGPTRAPRTP
jgi:small conductance mechanosensitive channel